MKNTVKISDLRLPDLRSQIWVYRSEIGSSSICDLRSIAVVCKFIEPFNDTVALIR